MGKGIKVMQSTEADSRFTRSQTPVWERRSRKLCFMKWRFQPVRSQTGVWERGQRHRLIVLALFPLASFSQVAAN